MKYLLYCFFLAGFLYACKGKKKELKDTSQYFPLRSFVQSQVKGLDTAGYSYLKIETINNRQDTVTVQRKDIEPYLADFTSIPDVKDPETGSNYEEIKNYDSLLERVFMSYTALEPDLEVRRQEITVVPTLTGSDQVKTVYIEKLKAEGDSTVEKKMLWEIGHFFSITTIVQKGNKEQINKTKILLVKSSNEVKQE